MELIHLTQDRVHWRVLANTVISILGYIKGGVFISLASISFSRSTLLHGVRCNRNVAAVRNLEIMSRKSNSSDSIVCGNGLGPTVLQAVII